VSKQEPCQNNFEYTIGKALKNYVIIEKRLDNSQGLPKGFSFEKRIFSEANISRSKADFDSRLKPMETMNLLLAVYTHFKGSTEQRVAHKSPLKWTIFALPRNLTSTVPLGNLKWPDLKSPKMDLYYSDI
jgi:hypothetical protein